MRLFCRNSLTSFFTASSLPGAVAVKLNVDLPRSNFRVSTFGLFMMAGAVATLENARLGNAVNDSEGVRVTRWARCSIDAGMKVKARELEP